jgi:DNA-directed RNA polymerase
LKKILEAILIFHDQICSSDMLDLVSQYMQMDGSLDEAQLEHVSVAMDDAPEINPVDQKGLGLSSLKQSLSLFTDAAEIQLPAGFQGTEEEAQTLRNNIRQQKLEALGVESALARWRTENAMRQKAGWNNSHEQRLNPVLGQWHTSLVARINKELELVQEALANPVTSIEQRDRCDYGVYLQSLDPDRLAALTIITVMSVFSRTGMDKGIKLSAIATTLGKELQDELIAKDVLAKNKGVNPNRLKALKEILATRDRREGRLRFQSLIQKANEEDTHVHWGSRVQVRVGASLMSMLFDVAKVAEWIEDPVTKRKVNTEPPAFQHAYQIHYGKRSGLIHMHPEIVKIVKKEPPSELLARHLPMITKPKPWTGPKTGGYTVYQSSLVRSTAGEILQPAYIRAAMKDDGMKEIRAGLDVLGGTAWRINRPVFDVMVQAWNTGEAVGKIAPLDPDLPMPPQPGPDADLADQQQWSRRLRDIENLRSGYHSIRCFQNFQLEIARAYRSEVFYLPHNMDFRGRAYPLPPYLNQMGADNCRGLLLFDTGKELGVSGLRWLKIQIANLSGFDKASMSEREQYTMDKLDDVLDSANNGLNGRKWWLKAEDPWQCLAACVELRNALQLSDPTTYVSHLPIHQDGSCNGLQHYAALGGDKAGAQQVNLEPSDRPSDVYSGVCDFVNQSITQDAANGNALAKVLDGRVTRKIVKQTVMTNVYGVTFMGATRQVRKQLVDYLPDLSVKDRLSASIYIAQKIFGALGSMFNGAHDIQYWLGDSALRITQSLTPQQIDQLTDQVLTHQAKTGSATPRSLDPEKSFQSTVIWTTPLGLPVVQPYRTRKARRVQTTLQEISIMDPSADDVVSKRKQLQAFPPNFIHSLDATHMILSANACHEAGLTFSAVHDSFWTHAGDVDRMNEMLRDAFVRMHSDDIIGRLAAEFNVRYGKNLFLARVPLTGKHGKAIRAMRKSGKGSKISELIQEHRRQNLLRSEDPEDQAEGRAMITAASIFEEMGGTDEDMSMTKSLGATAMGHVPDNLEAAERAPMADGIDTSDPAIQGLLGNMDMPDGKLLDDEPEPALEETDDTAAPAKKSTRRPTTWLWLPLKFRPVPAKGDWDLTRIRESKYFFS